MARLKAERVLGRLPSEISLIFFDRDGACYSRPTRHRLLNDSSRVPIQVPKRGERAWAKPNQIEPLA